MATSYLPDNDHIVRHVGAQQVDRDEAGRVVACFPQAFELRQNEQYLSSNWLEYFAGTLVECVAAIACSMGKTRTIKNSHAFMVGNVGDVKAACNEYNCKVRVIHEPNDDNPAYVAVRNYRSAEMSLLMLLATEAWAHHIVDAKDCLSLVGPWRPR
jgi:hypothetical protein